MNYRESNPKTDLVIVLIIVASVGLGCMGMKKPWRDYSKKTFNAAEWRSGDKIERGRMVLDLAKREVPNGLERDGVIEMLGEPDFKRTFENREVWFYRVD